MSTTPEENKPSPAPAESSSKPAAKKSVDKQIHQVIFVAYPKLLFIWPVILFGYFFYFFAPPARPTAEDLTANVAAMAAREAAAEAAKQEAESKAAAAEALPAAGDTTAASGEAAGEPAEAAVAEQPADPYVSPWLEDLGWAYIWVCVFVLLTLGVDIDRNQAAFWLVFVVAVWLLGLWLHDTRGFTLFGDIYRWFSSLDVQYNRGLALSLSILMSVPWALMIAWAHLNDRWRITHNEFEHYSFGKMDDSLGRGAKTIRTAFPDILELILGMAGTLIVYNAIGTKEIRRIPHVMFLPLVRKRLNKILERTAITAAMIEEEEDDDDV